MGDPRRHEVLADLVVERWPNRAIRIADVAGGKGMLNAALYRRGYRHVVTIDQRHDRWTHRPHYRYGQFAVADAAEFELIVAMHPDEATDVALAGAVAHDVPFAVVPCCARPTVWPFDPTANWLEHLVTRSGARVEDLPIRGANRVLTPAA